MWYKTNSELSMIFVIYFNKIFLQLAIYSFLAKRTNTAVKTLRLASYCLTQYFDSEIKHKQSKGPCSQTIVAFG